MSAKLSNGLVTTGAIAETHEGVLNLIFKLAHKWSFLYGGDVDESVAEANHFFLIAYRDYSMDKGMTFSSYCYKVITDRYLERSRNCAKRAARAKFYSLDEEKVQPAILFRQMADAVDEFTGDAHTVVKLLFEETESLLQHTERRSPQAMRKSIRQFLLNCGWTQERVAESFAEIQKALT